MNLKETLTSLKEFWQQFASVKSGLVGLAMLLVFMFVAVFGPVLSGRPESADRWSDITYWQDNPKSAPPVWTNLFAAKKSAETEVLLPFDIKDEQKSDSVVRTFIFNYDFRTDLAPSDMIFRVSGKGNSQVVLSVTRPDGVKAELYRNNIDLGSNAGYRVSLRNNSDRSIMEMVRQMDAYAAANLDINKFNPMTALTAKNEPTMATDPVALNGVYRMEMSLQSGDKNFSVSKDSVSVMVAGRVSGLLGTDGSKRDIMTGLLMGTRWALIIGLLTSVITVVVGVFLGVIAAYFGGVVDSTLNRLYEYVYMLPVLPFLIVLSAIFKPSITTLIIIICLLFWTGPFKPVYSMALQIREETYVEAAKALGARHRRLVFRHIIPILLPYSFAVMALSIPGVIVYEASVSLLGLGDPTIITFGQMLNESFKQSAVVSGLWWWVVPPGLLIALMGMSFAFLGTALDKLLHPKLKTR